VENGRDSLDVFFEMEAIVAGSVFFLATLVREEGGEKIMAVPLRLNQAFHTAKEWKKPSH